MGSRRELQTLLEELVENVYFQPPSNVMLRYPCIVYARDDADLRHADNNPYRRVWRYQITVMDRNPDSPIPDKVLSLSGSSYQRHFTSDSIYHDVLSVYF